MIAFVVAPHRQSAQNASRVARCSAMVCPASPSPSTQPQELVAPSVLCDFFLIANNRNRRAARVGAVPPPPCSHGASERTVARGGLGDTTTRLFGPSQQQALCERAGATGARRGSRRHGDVHPQRAHLAALLLRAVLLLGLVHPVIHRRREPCAGDARCSATAPTHAARISRNPGNGLHGADSKGPGSRGVCWWSRSGAGTDVVHIWSIPPWPAWPA